MFQASSSLVQFSSLAVVKKKWHTFIIPWITARLWVFERPPFCLLLGVLRIRMQIIHHQSCGVPETE